MRWGIFSDIHGNLPALQKVLEVLQHERIDRYYCLGDIVGYGASPEECIKIIQDIDAITIAGNHDWAAVGKLDLFAFNPLARESMLWTQKQLSCQSQDFLQELGLVHKTEQGVFVHSTLNEPEQFHYLIHPEEMSHIFSLMDRQLCFVGHTHIPDIFVAQNNRVSLQYPQQLRLQSEYQYIINVGSVGQPRDLDPRAAYCIYDSQEQTVEIKRVEYNIKEAQERIIATNLPLLLADRLSTGE